MERGWAHEALLLEAKLLAVGGRGGTVFSGGPSSMCIWAALSRLSGTQEKERVGEKKKK